MSLIFLFNVFIVFFSWNIANRSFARGDNSNGWLHIIISAANAASALAQIT